MNKSNNVTDWRKINGFEINYEPITQHRYNRYLILDFLLLWYAPVSVRDFSRCISCVDV